MKQLMNLKQVNTYRENLSLVQHDDGFLSIYGGVVNVTFPASAACIELWQSDHRTVIELKMRVYCQTTTERLLSLDIELTSAEAQELRRLVPVIGFKDLREVAA